MEVHDEISYNSLENCSYRYLQQLAKSMNLPSNVKKVYLLEMIVAKKYQSPEQLESIITRIREERKQTAKPRKTNARKKKRVQGTEISSTSNHSPPICSTPTYCHLSSQTINKNSIVNPGITKKTIESDRVLRSFNNKVRRNTKYSIMNINNTVASVVKSQNSVSQEVQERQYEWNMKLQRYRPVRVADCVVQRQQSLNADYMLPQPRQIFVDVNQIHRDIDSGERQLVPVARSSSASAVRERRLSGIYPLEQKQSYYQPLPGVGFRRQDGRISKINAVIQKPIRNPESMIKNKMTQTTVQRRLIQKPIVVSLKNALRPKLATVQDVVNYKIDGHFSNSSTESARESSTDREIVTMTSKSFQESFESTTFREKRDRLMKARDYSVENRIRAEITKAKKKYVDNMYVIENQTRRTDTNMYATANQNRRTDNNMYLTANQKRLTDTNMYVTGNQNRRTDTNMYVTGNQNRRTDTNMYVTGNQNRCTDTNIYATANQNRRTDNIYSTVNQARRPINKMQVTDNQPQRSETPYAIENQTRRTDNMYATDNQARNVEARVYVIDNANRPVRLANQNRAVDKQLQLKTYAKKTNRPTDEKICSVNKIKNSDYIIVITKEQAINKAKGTSNPNNAKESLIYIENKPENAIEMNQDSVANVNTDNIDRNETDYPNMSALTDVYSENRAEVISEASAEPSGPTVYYHKKIRAEQVRTQRLSMSLEQPAPAVNTLPHISEVFSKFNEPRFKQYMEPLYIDCGDDTKNTVNSTGRGLLETLYNYTAPDLEQPLNFHHVISTTNTKCVFATHTTTTAVARMPSTGHDQYDNLSMRDNQHKQDYKDVTCDEVFRRSPGSSLSSVPSELGEASSQAGGAEKIEDVLELISQDGDYMERIGMDVRMPCILCDWAGPKSILEYHIGQEHACAVVPRAVGSWRCSVSLARGARAHLLSSLAGSLYVLSGARAGDRARFHITMLPKDEDFEYLPKYGRLTIYNKITGEPHTWEDIIQDLDSTDENETRGLDVELHSLGLLPNSAKLKSVNEESTFRAIVGQMCLDDIEIEIHVQIFE